MNYINICDPFCISLNFIRMTEIFLTLNQYNLFFFFVFVESMSFYIFPRQSMNLGDCLVW